MDELVHNPIASTLEVGDLLLYSYSRTPVLIFHGYSLADYTATKYLVYRFTIITDPSTFTSAVIHSRSDLLLGYSLIPSNTNLAALIKLIYGVT